MAAQVLPCGFLSIAAKTCFQALDLALGLGAVFFKGRLEFLTSGSLCHFYLGSAYLGSALFAEIAARHNVTVNVKPAKFGPIFEQTGGLPLPKRSPQRRAYRLMELKRWREVRDIPLNVEPNILPMRRHSGDATGDRGQAAGQGRSPAVAGTGARGMGAGGNARRSRSLQRPPRGPGSMPRRCVRPALPTPNSMRCMNSIRRRPWQRACSARRALCCRRARSFGARTGWSCWSGRLKTGRLSRQRRQYAYISKMRPGLRM